MSENKKYRITDESRTMEDGSKVSRIESLIDIPSLNVAIGDEGGFIESEDNLSFEEGDLSWVNGDSVAYGSTEVKNGSVISRRSEVKDSIIDDTIVHKDSKVNGSKITGSHISHGTVVNDSVVEDSQMASDIVNGSRIDYSNTHVSTITNSTLEGVEGAGTVIDSHIENSDISELEREKYEGVRMVDGDIKSITESKKYKLTDNSIMHEGTEVFQIEALRDIPAHDIKAGELGGFIESEDNLINNQWDDAWVGHAESHVGGELAAGVVKDDSVISKNSFIGGSVVSGNSKVMDTYVHQGSSIKDSVVDRAHVRYGASINDSKVEGGPNHKSDVKGAILNRSKVFESQLEYGVFDHANVANVMTNTNSILSHSSVKDGSLEMQTHITNSKLENVSVIENRKISNINNTLEGNTEEVTIFGDVEGQTYGTKDYDKFIDLSDKYGAKHDPVFVNEEGQLVNGTVELTDDDLADLNDLDNDLKM